MDYHELSRKYLSKKGKLESILYDYYRTTGKSILTRARLTLVAMKKSG